MIRLVRLDRHFLLELGRLEHISQALHLGELLPLFRAFHKNLREAVDFAVLEAPSQFAENEGAPPFLLVHDVEALAAELCSGC